MKNGCVGELSGARCLLFTCESFFVHVHSLRPDVKNDPARHLYLRHSFKDSTSPCILRYTSCLPALQNSALQESLMDYSCLPLQESSPDFSMRWRTRCWGRDWLHNTYLLLFTDLPVRIPWRLFLPEETARGNFGCWTCNMESITITSAVLWPVCTQTWTWDIFDNHALGKVSRWYFCLFAPESLLCAYSRT